MTGGDDRTACATMPPFSSKSSSHKSAFWKPKTREPIGEALNGCRKITSLSREHDPCQPFLSTASIDVMKWRNEGLSAWRAQQSNRMSSVHNTSLPSILLRYELNRLFIRSRLRECYYYIRTWTRLVGVLACNPQMRVYLSHLPCYLL